MILIWRASEVGFTADRVVSLLTDFGVESAAWLMPDPSSTDQAQAAAQDNDDVCAEEPLPNPALLFKFCMPLPDCDHSLHHASCRNDTCEL